MKVVIVTFGTISGGFYTYCSNLFLMFSALPRSSGLCASSKPLSTPLVYA